ncbi:MAG: hypothetical protein HXY20_13395 [Acidobacteria bacterium]|nr:hypothetical protein [Acidobacteriota bacterium]
MERSAPGQLDSAAARPAAGSTPVLVLSRKEKGAGPGRRAGLEGILGLTALTLELVQDVIDDARIGDDRDNLHARAASA